MENIVDRIIERIVEVLKVFYKWPAVFTVEAYGNEYYVSVLAPLKRLWYKYEEPVGNNVILALLYEGVKEISGPTELSLFEVAVKHVKSREILFTFLGDSEVQHLYKIKPTGKVIKIYATKEENDVAFVDVSQLKQFIEMRLQCWLCRNS